MHRQLLVLLILIGLTPFIHSQTHEVEINTNLGNITVTLYDTAPMHRDNFLRLVNSGHFDETLFYRVIKDFVIQGGSSDSRKAYEGKHIGYGESLNINAEMDPTNFHKKGALCAPRQPDEINLFKKSDISQFYIVIGRVFTNEELNILENNHNIPIKVALKRKHYVPQKEKLAQLKVNDPAGFNKLLKEIKDEIEFEYVNSNLLKYTPEQRQAYTTEGGIPDLDKSYTVFGEVIKGLDVVEKINALSTDKNDRPYTDVKMELIVIK